MSENTYTRDHENLADRLDRNYSELLQELRVAQTGVQILFAFLLAMAFQNRFAKLEQYQREIYLATLIAAACAAVLLIAPAAVHRRLFRTHQKDELVDITARLAGTGLVFLGMAILSGVLLVVDVVAGLTAGIVLAVVLAALMIWLWFAMPIRIRRRRPSGDLRL
jgi:O-antigen/teichoic acid export membrane protein